MDFEVTTLRIIRTKLKGSEGRKDIHKDLEEGVKEVDAVLGHVGLGKGHYFFDYGSRGTVIVSGGCAASSPP